MYKFVKINLFNYGFIKNNIDKEIPLVVKRQDTTITTSITPKTWGGKGLLGLHLTPLKRL
jgi:hypothetical protein